MKTVEEIREEFEKDANRQPAPINRQLPASTTLVLPRLPGQFLPARSHEPPAQTYTSIVMDEETGKVSRQVLQISDYPRSVGPEHDWGWNRITGAKIHCGCGSTSRDRVMHLITCPVWMTKDIVVYYPKGNQPKEPMNLEHSALNPCTNWAHTNCRVRSSDRTTYCKNCLAEIGVFRNPDSRLGAVEDV